MSETQAVTNAILAAYNPDYETIDTTISDQYSELIAAYLCRSLGSVTIATDTALDDRVIAFEAGHGIQVGELLCLRENTRFLQTKVIAVDTNNITIGIPLDYAYTTAATVTRMSINANVDGSSSVVEYKITPPTGATWDITELVIDITDNAAMDSGTFGGIAALTNGCYLRVENGITKNLGNIRTNGDFRRYGLSVEYDPKAPSGVFGVTAKAQFRNGAGVVLRLSAGDYVVLGIQDNLTALSSFVVTIIGHEVVD